MFLRNVCGRVILRDGWFSCQLSSSCFRLSEALARNWKERDWGIPSPFFLLWDCSISAVVYDGDYTYVGLSFWWQLSLDFTLQCCCFLGASASFKVSSKPFPHLCKWSHFSRFLVEIHLSGFCVLLRSWQIDHIQLLNKVGLNCMAPLIYRFFFNKYLHCLQSWLGQWMWRTNYMHSPIHFYSLIEHSGFWYPKGSWNQSPVDTEGQRRFWGSQSYRWIFNCVLFKGQLHMINCF